MLAADVRFEGFTQTDWGRVLSLFRPRGPAGRERDPDRPQGTVVAVQGGGRLRKLLHTQAGRLRLDDVASDWPLTAEELARRHHASFSIVLELGALENVMERFGARLRRGDDLTSQILLLVTLTRDEVLAGRIQYHPARLSGLPVPSPAMVARTLDAVCPRGDSLLVGLFDAGELWTSIALRRGAGGTFDRILGPDELRRDMGLLAGDWRRDYRHLARAVERKIGKLSLGVFSEESTFRRLEVDEAPGAWARAVAIRDVILSPVPVALTIPLGVDAGRAAFGVLRSFAERAPGIAAAVPALAAARELVGELAAAALPPGSQAHPGEGFQPLEMLRRLLARER